MTTITSRLLETYVKCHTKCWLTHARAKVAGDSYEEWLQANNAKYQREEVDRLLATTPAAERLVGSLGTHPKLATWTMATNVPVVVSGLKSQLLAVARIPSAGRGKVAQFVPIRLFWSNKIGRDEKLLLAFDALVLSIFLGRSVPYGKLVYGDGHAVLKMKTAGLFSEVKTLINKIGALLLNTSPPDLILNRHCAECEFQTRCRQAAVEKDELSLLARMTDKDRKKFHGKGIFTVTQLSHTFRPRRRAKRRKDKHEKYHHALKALAIRERKIHIVGSPTFEVLGTPVYLDVEGLPDLDFYYLIGVRIVSNGTARQYSFWADTLEEERANWNELLRILGTVANPMLIHYGSYETTFLRRMCDRYGGPPEESAIASAIGLAVNLVSVTFAQVYFPTFSNGLKEIAGYLGFRWSNPVASGLQSIRWRQEWEQSKAPPAKLSLITYNAEDCEAVEVLANKLAELRRAAPQAGELLPDGVVDTTLMKRKNAFGFGRNKFVFPELEVINKAAYWDYQRERVYVKSNKNIERAVRKPSMPKKVSTADTTIDCPRPICCPKCRSTSFHAHQKKCKTVFDLKFMRHGVKRWISRFWFHRYKCLSCCTVFTPEQDWWQRGKFGLEFMAYALYQNIELRLPQESVIRSINKLFDFHLPRTTTSRIKQAVAKTYEDAYKALIARLCNGRLLHVDETKVSIKGQAAYVWVFANLEEVAYIYSDTREGTLLQTLLSDFSGVLVSDFYAAYDGIACPQQKCLIHLIRDMNEEVLKHPYDDQLKHLCQAFANLVRPMIATVDRYGLKKHFLTKHGTSVVRFYRILSTTVFNSEAAVKLRERLLKNQEKLFTFLNIDEIPWNNNNAEHAVKAFATLRKVIGGTSTEKGIREYLILLSLCETCKYKGLDFLDFLRSGETDINAFASKRNRKIPAAVRLHHAQ